MKRMARVQQRKRKTWLALPAIGMKRLTMAKSGQERSAKSTKKRIEHYEKELRHRLRLSSRQKPEELMT